MKEKLTLRKRKKIYYTVIVAALVLILVAALTPLSEIDSISNVMIIGSILAIGADILWFACTFRCPHCGGRLSINSMFPIRECPHCKAKLPNLELLKDE